MERKLKSHLEVKKHSNEDKKCDFCEKSTAEYKLLLWKLLEKLKKVMKNEEIEYNGAKNEEKEDLLSNFKNLVNTVLGLSKQGKESECCHLKLQKQFQKKLRCSRRILGESCREVLGSLAEKSYQLDILIQQIVILEKKTMILPKADHESELKEKNEQAGGKGRKCEISKSSVQLTKIKTEEPEEPNMNHSISYPPSSLFFFPYSFYEIQDERFSII